MRLVEIKGLGRLWLGHAVVLDPAPYVVRYASEDAAERARRLREDDPPPFQIEGRVTAPIPSPYIGVIVVLELEDGRRWRCKVESADGTLVDRGGLSAVPR